MAYNQMNLADIATEDEDYKAFVDKFKPKKTTDDCYTPDNIYKVVADWVAKEYHLDPACFVRPFWPGGDYQNEHYPEGCVVVDNPPFSIRAQIMDFYNAYGVKYFLFAPTLTLLSGTLRGVCNIVCGVQRVREPIDECGTGDIRGSADMDDSISRQAVIDTEGDKWN